MEKKKNVIFCCFLVIVFLTIISLNFRQVDNEDIDIIVTTAPYDEKISIYAEPNEKSEVIAETRGQTCLTCNLYSENKTINGFIKVELFDKEGYIRATDCIRDTLYISDIKDINRQEVCKTALKYLGTPYKNMQCNSLIEKSYSTIGINYSNLSSVRKYNSNKVAKEITGKELQPGDFVFYHGYNNNLKDGHVGLYLGRGYVIQSTLDAGSEYPLGGVRITKLVFRSEPTVFRSPFK